LTTASSALLPASEFVLVILVVVLVELLHCSKVFALQIINKHHSSNSKSSGNALFIASLCSYLDKFIDLVGIVLDLDEPEGFLSLSNQGSQLFTLLLVRLLVLRLFKSFLKRALSILSLTKLGVIPYCVC
jgi:hypothetical protein